MLEGLAGSSTLNPTSVSAELQGYFSPVTPLSWEIRKARGKMALQQTSPQRSFPHSNLILSWQHLNPLSSLCPSQFSHAYPLCLPASVFYTSHHHVS